MFVMLLIFVLWVFNFRGNNSSHFFRCHSLRMRKPAFARTIITAPLRTASSFALVYCIRQEWLCAFFCFHSSIQWLHPRTKQVCTLADGWRARKYSRDIFCYSRLRLWSALPCRGGKHELPYYRTCCLLSRDASSRVYVSLHVQTYACT